MFAPAAAAAGFSVSTAAAFIATPLATAVAEEDTTSLRRAGRCRCSSALAALKGARHPARRTQSDHNKKTCRASLSDTLGSLAASCILPDRMQALLLACKRWSAKAIRDAQCVAPCCACQHFCCHILEHQTRLSGACLWKVANLMVVLADWRWSIHGNPRSGFRMLATLRECNLAHPRAA